MGCVGRNCPSPASYTTLDQQLSVPPPVLSATDLVTDRLPTTTLTPGLNLMVILYLYSSGYSLVLEHITSVFQPPRFSVCSSSSR
jgi:hypothetical protein